MLKKIRIISFLLLIEITNLHSNSLRVTSFNISNNEVAVGISFGTITNFIYKIANQYLKINYSVTNSDYIIQIYSDNSNAISSDSLYNGLVGINNNDTRIPLYWQVYTNCVTSNLLFNEYNINQWGSVRDKRDYDWSNQWKNRVIISNGYLTPYPNRIYTTNTNIYLYLASYFNVTKDDTYKTYLHIDLIPQEFIPGITSLIIKAPTVINILGDKIVIYADIYNEKKIEKVHFYYKKRDEKAFKEEIFLPDTIHYYMKGEISASECNESGFEYYISVESKGIVTNSKTNSIFYKKEVSKLITDKGGTITLVDGNVEDGEAELYFPPNSIINDINIKFYQERGYNIISSKGIVAGEEPLMVYKIEPEINFNSPVSLKLLYFDLNNNGKIERINGVETDINENTLAICWWDGFEWRYLGGDIDTINNTISVKINHSLIAGIFSIPELKEDFFRPEERIITLNNDGINDCLYFGGNKDLIEKIYIYDIKGKIVKKVSNLKWDGKDNNGEEVESGVYIYQMIVNYNNKKSIISGTFIIVK